MKKYLRSRSEYGPPRIVALSIILLSMLCAGAWCQLLDTEYSPVQPTPTGSTLADRIGESSDLDLGNEKMVLKNADTYPFFPCTDFLDQFGDGTGKAVVWYYSGLVKVVKRDDILISDQMGNKPIGCNLYSVPKEHIPDLRIYNTYETVFNDYIKYEHSIAYGFANTRMNGGSVKGNISGEKRYRFEYMYLQDPGAFEERLSDRIELGDGFVLEKYNIDDAVKAYYKALGVSRNETIQPLSVLKDGNTVIWLSAEATYITSARYKGGYMVVSDHGADYVKRENGTIVSDFYKMNIINSYDKDGGFPIKSGKILTDNIIRIEFKNGAVIHMKVKLTKEDCDKNLLSDLNGTEQDHQRVCAAIIWNNGKYTINEFKTAWDLNSDTSSEPVYKKNF